MVAIGMLKDEDLTREHSSQLLSYNLSLRPVTMTIEYAWSQIEPATAILCACIVTYRPLFNIRVNLSKLSGILSYGRHESTTTDGDCCNRVKRQKPISNRHGAEGVSPANHEPCCGTE